MSAVARIGIRVEDQASRRQTLLARLRRRQLELAIAGRVEDSARYARRAAVLGFHPTDSLDEDESALACSCCGM